MLPRMPPPLGQVGFVYVPPYRVQGISVAGEQTVIQVPELDVVFDMGTCPRFALSSEFVALSHGHMDHVGGLPYYFSQRLFQKMGTGTCVCHPDLEKPILAMMASWADLEHQRTPHHIVPLGDGQDLDVKQNVSLRALEVSHRVPANGYALVERRSKLKPEYVDEPQERLRELKRGGTEITYVREIPLIAYTGDTQLAPSLYRDEFAKAKIVISECTFFDAEHRQRASVGRHLHVDDLRQLLEVWEAEAVIIGHVSRRTDLGRVQQTLRKRLREEDLERVHLLMDHRGNKARYQRQVEAAEQGRGAGAAATG